MGWFLLGLFLGAALWELLLLWLVHQRRAHLPTPPAAAPGFSAQPTAVFRDPCKNLEPGSALWYIIGCWMT